MEKESAMANALKEAAIDNEAFEIDEQREDVKARRVTGAQLPDNPQNGVYVVPISQNPPKDSSAIEKLTGDMSTAGKDGAMGSQRSRNYVVKGKTENARAANSVMDIKIESSAVHNTLASANEINMKPTKGTVLYFSNKGFEDDNFSSQQQQITIENQGITFKSERQIRRKKFVVKLRSLCIHIHLRCIGIALTCLIILALFVVPPSTTW